MFFLPLHQQQAHQRDAQRQNFAGEKVKKARQCADGEEQLRVPRQLLPPQQNHVGKQEHQRKAGVILDAQRHQPDLTDHQSQRKTHGGRPQLSAEQQGKAHAAQRDENSCAQNPDAPQTQNTGEGLEHDQIAVPVAGIGGVGRLSARHGSIEVLPLSPRRILIERAVQSAGKGVSGILRPENVEQHRVGVVVNHRNRIVGIELFKHIRVLILLCRGAHAVHHGGLGNQSGQRQRQHKGHPQRQQQPHALTQSAGGSAADPAPMFFSWP